MTRHAVGALAALALILAACASTTPSAQRPASGAAAGMPMARQIVVHRSAGCSCCHGWETYLSEHGWDVISTEEVDIGAYKQRMGIPENAWSCHTAVVDGYVVEGHVPLAAIERLLSERPQIRGIALPGMPAGSPGMTGVATGPFDVLAITDGSTTSEFGAFE